MLRGLPWGEGTWPGEASSLREQDARPPRDSEFLERLETLWERIDREELVCFVRDLVCILSVFRPGNLEKNEALAGTPANKGASDNLRLILMPTLMPTGAILNGIRRTTSS